MHRFYSFKNSTTFVKSLTISRLDISNLLSTKKKPGTKYPAFSLLSTPQTDHEIILPPPSSFLMGSFSFLSPEVPIKSLFKENRLLTFEVRY